MQNYPIAVGEPLAVLTTAGELIANSETAQANALLDDLLATLDLQDDITKLCALALRHRDQENLPMYRRDLNEDDKQINVFDLVLQSVPPVRLVSTAALQLMIRKYSAGFDSFTHLNIGIGKGRFEIALLQELAQLSPEKMPKLIKVIGIDIDNESLRETGQAIEQIARTQFPESTVIEYTPIFAFAEAITEDTWKAIRNHSTDLLGVMSAFTLHHIPTQNQRQSVINCIAECTPGIFVLLEPDVDHFTQHLPSRVTNCWKLFGQIFKLIDKKGLPDHEADALKCTFFGREIQDILGNEESKRSEKHEPAHHWSKRLQQAGFAMQTLAYLENFEGLLAEGELEIAHNIQSNFLTTRYQKVPLVAMFAASTTE